MGDLSHLRAGRVRVDRALQSVRLLETAHEHRVLDGPWRVGWRELKPTARSDDRAHPEIDAGRELAVDANLLLARGPPAGERAVVKERKPHRLLDLVGERAGEEHPGSMRLMPSTTGRVL